MDDALSRRIEELAGFDDSDSSTSRDDAAFNAVRAEVVAVRADLASLRGEIGSVRTDLDGLGGRLTGSVAASRTETGTLVRRVAELTTRLEAVGTRVDEVRTAVPGLGRELREGLDLIPVRTSQALDEITTRISDGLGSRVDAAIGDVRRTVGTALDTGSRSASASQAALVDARGAIETRLGNLEDAIDAVSERIDSLFRDSTGRVTERMATFAQQVADLSTRVDASGAEQVEHTVARLRDVTETGLDALSTQVNEQVRVSTGDLRREVTAALARQERESAETRESVEALADSVRTALTGFATALTSGLTGLGSTLSEALGESREETRVELDALTDRLLGTVTDLDAGVRRHQVEAAGRIDGLQSALEGRTESVRSGVIAALADVRADLGSEVGVLRPILEGVATDVAGGAAASSLLRGDLLDALESVRERVMTSTTASVQGVRSTLDATRAELTDSGRQLRQAVLDRLEEQHVDLLGRLDTLDSAGTGRRGQLEALGGLLEQWRTELAALLASETDRGAQQTGEQVAAGTSTALGALTALSATVVDTAAAQTARTAEVAAALTGKLDEVAAASAAQAVAADAGSTALGERLTGANDALSTSVREALAAQSTVLTEAQSALVGRVDDAQGALAARVEEMAESLGTRLDSTSEAQQLRLDESRAVLSGRVDELARSLEELRVQLDAGTTDVTSAGDALLGHLQAHDGAVRDLLWELGTKDSSVPRPPGSLTSAEARAARAARAAEIAERTKQQAAEQRAADKAAADQAAKERRAAEKAAEKAAKDAARLAAKEAAAAAAQTRTVRAPDVVTEAPEQDDDEVLEATDPVGVDEPDEAVQTVEAVGTVEEVPAKARAAKKAPARAARAVPVKASKAPAKATKATKAPARAAKAAGKVTGTASAVRTLTDEAEEVGPRRGPTGAKAEPRKRPAGGKVSGTVADHDDDPAAAPEEDALASVAAPKPPPWAQGARTPAARRVRLEQATRPVSPERALDAAAPPEEAPTESLEIGARRQSWSSPPPDPIDEPVTDDGPDRRFFRRRRG